ncbi:MAG TPA: metal-dependent transcriptional regulator [Chloroflexi bacterium]|nr:metal-dependent transcriptional regulator [Chloroflexota bacterium]
MTVSESTEMYLKSILELEHDGEPVAISGIAERLGVSTVSANEMIKRLVERQMVTHTPYRGVQLTELGRRRAVNILRRHRLWERFLVDHLGIPWEQAHDPACRMEHVASDEIADALAVYLGNPETCPHGNPIPPRDGELIEKAAVPLSELEVGQSGHVSHIYREETALLEYLAERGLYPEVPVLVEDIAPYNGPLTVRVGRDQTVILGREIAAHVLIRLDEA